MRKEVDSKVVEIRRGGNRGDGEEAGGHEVSLSQMRSDLFCLSLAQPVGACRALSVDLMILRLDVGIAKHCRVMSVITPTAVGRARGPYVERPSWHEIAGPTKATDR